VASVSLNSCLSKTFTAVLNNRLNKFADEVELISGAQAGFRSGFSTVDNIFVLLSPYFTPTSLLKNTENSSPFRIYVLIF
jgi:hypothetical protein